MAERLFTECTDLVFFLFLALKLKVISWVKTRTAVWRHSSLEASKVDLFLNHLCLPFCHGHGVFPQEGPEGGSEIGGGRVGDLPGSAFADKAHDFSSGCRSY